MYNLKISNVCNEFMWHFKSVKRDHFTYLKLICTLLKDFTPKFIFEKIMYLLVFRFHFIADI